MCCFLDFNVCDLDKAFVFLQIHGARLCQKSGMILVIKVVEVIEVIEVTKNHFNKKYAPKLLFFIDTGPIFL